LDHRQRLPRERLSPRNGRNAEKLGARPDDDGEEGDDDDADQEVVRDDDKDDDEEGEDDEHESDEETKEEESFDPIPQTLKDSEDKGDGEEDLGLNIGEEERHDEEEEEDKLYRYGSSSVSSQFVTSLLNPTLDVGMESIFETTSQLDVLTSTKFRLTVSL
nr:hypothetical protein [Tanacetum cinerariifolium]